jgi:hypothetical protein
MIDTETSIVLVALVVLAAMILVIMARGFADALCVVVAIALLITQKLTSILPPGSPTRRW